MKVSFQVGLVVCLLVELCFCSYSGLYKLENDSTTCALLGIPPTQQILGCGNYIIALGLDFEASAVVASDGSFNIALVEAAGLVSCRGLFTSSGSDFTGTCFSPQVYCTYGYAYASNCGNAPAIQGIWNRGATNGTCPESDFPQTLAIFQCGTTARLMSNNPGGLAVDIELSSTGSFTFEVSGISCSGTVYGTAIEGTCSSFCNSFTYYHVSDTC
jgi:hypothetical protein